MGWLSVSPTLGIWGKQNKVLFVAQLLHLGTKGYGNILKVLSNKWWSHLVATGPLREAKATDRSSRRSCTVSLPSNLSQKLQECLFVSSFVMHFIILAVLSTPKTPAFQGMPKTSQTHMGVDQNGYPRWNPGKWKQGPNLRSNSWWLNFDSYPYLTCPKNLAVKG